MASIWTARARFLLLAAVLLIGINVARQGYRWFAFADERDSLRRLGTALDSVALTVVRTQIQADSLRGAIQQTDGRLRTQLRDLTRIERRANGDGLPPMLYEEYRRGLESYNGRVAGRNAAFDRWRETVVQNHAAVDSYNALADSIRGVGAAMGEPYIPVPTPAEVAIRHGLLKAPSPAAPLPEDRLR